MKNNSSEAHPASLPRKGVLKTKISGSKNLRKISAKNSSFNVTGFLDVSLITAYKKEKLLLESFSSVLFQSRCKSRLFGFHVFIAFFKK